MTDFSQPSSNAYAINGYNFFRLNTQLASPGDIFESEQSGHAFAIGPESDISKVNIAYFDDQVSTFVNQTIITPDRSWTGRLDARNEARYAPSGRPGKILFWPAELYDEQYVPSVAGAGVTGTIIVPTLDVIQYFKPQDSLVPKRNDRQIFIQELPAGANGGFLLVPYYGRKYASIRMRNLTSNNVDWEVIGVNFYMNDTGAGMETVITASATIATGASSLTIVKAGTHGMFDYLLLFIDQIQATDGPWPIEITTSDTPVG